MTDSNTIKRYITWDYFMADPRYLTHPDSAVKAWSNVITFTAKITDKGGVIGTNGDNRYLGIIEYSVDLKETVLTKFMNKFAYHTFTFVTKEKALELCKEWYGDTFELDSDGFSLIDNRPIDIN